MTSRVNPRTWIVGETVTAAMLNEQLRDNMNALWPYLAKGDLAAASASDTLVKIPAGADGTVLTASAAEPSGMKFATPLPQMVVVKKTATQTIAKNATGTLSWDSEDYDDWSGHDNAVNNSRITVAVAGIYQLIASIVVTDIACAAYSDDWIVTAYKSGAAAKYIGYGDFVGGATAMSVVGAPQPLSAGEYIEVKIFNSTYDLIIIGVDSRFTLLRLK